MAERNFVNPFSDYGNIVYGNRFINRRDSIRVVENRVIRPKEPGNLAIIGDYRIGKSSLVYHSIMNRKSNLLKEGRIPIWINLATFGQSPIFFRSLVISSYEELGDLGLLSDEIRSAAERALQDEISWSEGYGRIQRYFEKVRRAGLRIVFILDEFDHARHLFKEDISGFQGLRELSYRPEWRITLVTTSRRSLQSIELQTRAISTLDHTFYKYYLGMFDEYSLEEYFERLSSVGIIATPQTKERFIFYCGAHPYLLEMIGYEVVELFREIGIVDVDRAAKCVEQSIVDHYEHMLDILNESENLKKIVQVLFGPVIDVKPADVEELQKYGLIKFNDEGSCLAFSGHFRTYLKMIERQLDLWPLWRETETTLRHVISKKMIDYYGEQWIDKLCKSKSNLKTIFDKCRDLQQREEKTFGSRASRNLIDFAYPKDLFDIIFTEWAIFKDIFGKDKNYWDHRAQMLSKIRNSLAHNRDQMLYDYERQVAEGYCKELLIVLQEGNFAT